MTGRLVAACVALWIAIPAAHGPAAFDRPTQTAPTPAGPDGLPSGAEYPPQDQQVLSLVSRGAAAKLATRRLRDSPDSLETIRLLVTQERVDELLPSLQRLVERHPERMAEAFEILLSNMWAIERDGTRGYKARLADLVASARKQVPALPLEEAARAERVLLNFDGYLSPSARNPDDRTLRLKNFIQTYAGTEAALLAEVDVLTSGRVSFQQFDALEAFARAHPHTRPAAKALYARGFNLAVNVGVTRDGKAPQRPD